MMLLVLIAPYDGRGIRPASFPHEKHRQKRGLGQDASCYFRSFELAASRCLSLSFSLPFTAEQPETITDSLKLGVDLHFPLSKPLVCQKGI